MDFELREAERKKDHSPEDRASWLRLRMGLGHFSEGQLEFMDYCGDEGAGLVVSKRKRSLLGWFFGLIDFGPKPVVLALGSAALTVGKTDPDKAHLIDMAMAFFKGSDGLPDFADHMTPADDVMRTAMLAIGARVGELFHVAPFHMIVEWVKTHEKSILRDATETLRRWTENGGGRYRPEGDYPEPPDIQAGGLHGVTDAPPGFWSGDPEEIVGEPVMADFASPVSLGGDVLIAPEIGAESMRVACAQQVAQLEHMLAMTRDRLAVYEAMCAQNAPADPEEVDTEEED